MEEYSRLLPHCKTQLQTELIQTVIMKNGNIQDTAEYLDKAATNIYRTVRHLNALADAYEAQQAYNVPTTPDFAVKKISERYSVNEDGEQVVQGGWVQKIPHVAEQAEAFEDWLSSQAASRIPRAEPTACPESTAADLLASYEIGDMHLGVYAWAEETGTNWNTQMGRDILRKGINHLVAMAPAAQTAFILDTGDFFHSDNQTNRTNHSGHALDVDGRWGEILDAGVGVIIDIIDLALHKHEIVYFRSAEGNHDEHTARMMNLAIKMRYHNEPRVIVLDSAIMHHYYQFGVNMLADTHSHTGKADNLPLIAAVDQPQMWADTTNRIFRIGHIHHHSSKEYPGMTVTSYNTLAPQDVWHRNSGYRSNRSMTCTTYHKELGTVGTNVVNPTMLGY